MHGPLNLYYRIIAETMNCEYIKLLVVCFLLGNYPVSGFYMPTFRNTLSVWLQTFSRTISYPTSFYSHLHAYEEGTDRVFRNVDI